jgi:hypothetical protein
MCTNKFKLLIIFIFLTVDICHASNSETKSNIPEKIYNYCLNFEPSEDSSQLEVKKTNCTHLYDYLSKFITIPNESESETKNITLESNKITLESNKIELEKKKAETEKAKTELEKAKVDTLKAQSELEKTIASKAPFNSDKIRVIWTIASLVFLTVVNIAIVVLILKFRIILTKDIIIDMLKEPEKDTTGKVIASDKMSFSRVIGFSGGCFAFLISLLLLDTSLTYSFLFESIPTALSQFLAPTGLLVSILPYIANKLAN